MRLTASVKCYVKNGQSPGPTLQDVITGLRSDTFNSFSTAATVSIGKEVQHDKEWNYFYWVTVTEEEVEPGEIIRHIPADQMVVIR